MKLPYFKYLLIAGALMLAWNCGDDTTLPMGALSGMSENVRVIDIGPNENLYVAEDGTVYDSQWNVFGTYSEGNIVTNEGETFLSGVDLNDRPQAKVVETNGGTKMVEFDDGSVTDIQGNNIGTVDEGGNVVGDNGEIIAENPDAPAVTSSASGTNPTSAGTNPGTNPGTNSVASTSSNSNSGPNTPTSSAAAQQTNQCDGKCYDAPSGTCVAYYDNLKGPHQEQYAYDKSCKVNCWYDPTNKDCKDMGGSTVAPSSSASQQTQSSANHQQTPSSSSKNNTTPSSSSKAQSNGPSLLPKVIGQEKDGYATRYWDSCKPHCAWSGKGGPVARTCHADGSKAGVDEASACDGGPAGTCTDQIPQIVNDTIAYAFAATPGGGNDCGKCYMLTFKGTGASATNTPTDDAHKSIKGKHLIVMASNIGYDVSNNQFDIMIPGGGTGAFSGCQKMGLSCAGASHGGFLTTCNFSKSCLINMCNQEYANNANMKQGCLFLANWMNAANNPEVKFVEVECPSALSAKY
jgi:hypothetical protein